VTQGRSARIWYAGAYTVQTSTVAPITGRVWGPPPSGWNNSATVGVRDPDQLVGSGTRRFQATLG
jgi:hypothetical protein